MSPLSRTLTAIASLAMLIAFVTPIWTITLDAPQYPEGLGMHIRINNITGVSEHDLKNINGLNHYIGMQVIEPDSIKELVIMPWLVGFLALFGLITAASGKRWMLYAWTSVFLIVAIVGLVDFYLWEYDYGHNLDLETASIQIPGMTYQPPLIGSKKLLNFTANSWPAIGGIAIMGANAVGMVLSFLEFKTSRISADQA